MSDMEEGEQPEGEMIYGNEPENYEGEQEVSPGEVEAPQEEYPHVEEEDNGVPGMPDDMDDNLMEGVWPDQSQSWMQAEVEGAEQLRLE